MKRLFLTFLILPTSACTALPQPAQKNQLCSMSWYQQVESKVAVSDNQGHGPDLGSNEWRSAVEFKLGIRGNKAIPAVDSEQWCDYINRHFLISNPDQ